MPGNRHPGALWFKPARLAVRDCHGRGEASHDRRHYRRAFRHICQGRQAAARPVSDDPRVSRAERVRDSAIYLAENMHRVPVMIIPCIKGRVENGSLVAQASLYGSILPATWSLMLALSSRGIGSAWTTLHLFYEQEVGEILGIPRRYDTGGAAAGSLLPRRGLSSGKAHSGTRTDLREHVDGLETSVANPCQVRMDGSRERQRPLG